MKKDFFWNNILSWYSINKRNYPWREVDNPFYILVAEFLLQQTRADSVLPVYNKVIEVYNTPKELAEANQSELEEIIKPLGLIVRAERMIRSANIIVDDYNGNIPKNRNKLKELPGVGDYISDAVLCYGFGYDTIPIDTNILRLFTRYFDLNVSKKRKNVENLREDIDDKFLEFNSFEKVNLAALDFASLVCKAINPNCDECILSKRCNFDKN